MKIIGTVFVIFLSYFSQMQRYIDTLCMRKNSSATVNNCTLQVKLMNQIKEDATKNRQKELQRNREVAKLKKEQRLKDNQIRNLETEKNRKELVLKRKQEEVGFTE